MSGIELFEEAKRQLTICNACRFCEGYCAVWPALERRRELDNRDVVQLANLCHDCGECLSACMYADPHPFGVDPPEIFAQLRRTSYQAGRPAVMPSSRPILISMTLVLAMVVLTGIVVLSHGWSALATVHSSPYSVMRYWLFLAAIGVPFLWGGAWTLRECWAYWSGRQERLRSAGARRASRAALQALGDAGRLRNLHGGGAACAEDESVTLGAWRRVSHHCVAYGFGLCVLSTVAAAVEQDLLGIEPPYPIISVPVLAGTVGGIGIMVGCIGLSLVRRAAGTSEGGDASRVAMFTAALGALAATGLLVEVLRDTDAYGALLVLHLAVVATSFALAPFSRFVHGFFRLLALMQDHLEQMSETT